MFVVIFFYLVMWGGCLLTSTESVSSSTAAHVSATEPFNFTSEIDRGNNTLISHENHTSNVTHGVSCPEGNFCPPGGLCCQTLICCPDPNYKKPMNETEQVSSPELTWSSILLHSSLPIIFICLLVLIVCLTWSSCPLFSLLQFNKKYTKDDAGCAQLMGQLPVYMRVIPSDDLPSHNNVLHLSTSFLDDEGFERISIEDDDALI